MSKDLSSSKRNPGTFFYHCGKVVQARDIVRVRTDKGWQPGVIESIVPPGTRVADDLVCPDGGVFIEVDWGDLRDLELQTPPDGILDEEVELVARGGGPEDRQESGRTS